MYSRHHVYKTWKEGFDVETTRMEAFAAQSAAVGGDGGHYRHSHHLHHPVFGLHVGPLRECGAFAGGGGKSGPAGDGGGRDL